LLDFSSLNNIIGLISYKLNHTLSFHLLLLVGLLIRHFKNLADVFGFINLLFFAIFHLSAIILLF